MIGSWTRRLVATQLAVLGAMCVAVTATALAVGPALFDAHMRQAGHDSTDVLDHAEQAFRDAGLVSLGVGLTVALAIAVGLSWVLNRRLVRGLDALAAGASRVAAGHYDEPVAMPNVGPELAQVADEFNHMAAQIDATEATRRQLLTDLGHELRTPLAATQVTLEGLQDGVVDYSPDTLAVLVRQNARLTALASDIAEVSAAEEGRLRLDTRPLDLNDLVASCLDAFAEPYRRAGVRLTAAWAAGVHVVADTTRLGQVVDNLLRNALQHTRPGDTVTVTTSREGAEAVITVADTGVGIAPEALPHVFERFYRADGARTRDPGSGTGVGLAIARAIVRAYAGQLDAASPGRGKGATFTTRLPAS